MVMTLEYLEIMEDVRNEQKVPRKIRGTLTIKAEDDLEFRAERKTGISSQEEIAKTAAGKIYRTVGEQKRSMVAHIVIPEKETDVPAFLHEAVTKLTAGMQSKTKAKMPAGGRLVWNDDDLSVKTVAKEHKIYVNMVIDVKQSPDYNSTMLKLMSKVSQCFAINQSSLNLLR